MKKYDILVVGAGPAGSMAARAAAEGGRSVCILERKSRVGIPVRCGEGIGMKGFSRHLELRREWVKATIKSFRMISPAGYRVDFKNFHKNVDKSFVVDRELMDADLAKDAVKAGAELHCNTPVVSIERHASGMYECITPEERYTGWCVILAEGIESRLARKFGWRTSLSFEDIESCAFTRIYDSKIDSDTMELYLGSHVAPGGYAWIFPRGDGSANAGLGVLGTLSGPGKAEKYLKKFIAEKFPGARKDIIHCGGVPVGRWIRPLYRDGVMIVGDAASQVNALSGGGIAYALHAGTLAGRAAARAFKKDRFDARGLKEYHKQWARFFGKYQDRSYAVKKMVIDCYDDKFFDKTALSLMKEDPERLNTIRFALKAFAGHPIVLLKSLLLFR
ncbi:MAG: geranylgeranyl reductase family protein [Chitinivibrionales bacterium]|nr:geranylgeranyl reductase family protein [Chitinivibrionales bacterium]